MFDPKRFQQKLRQARTQAGLTQGELARQLFVSTQAVSKWERGEAVPDISHICRVAELLRVTTDFLLDSRADRPGAVIAVDGGGTKTEFVLADLQGQLLKRLVLAGSNPNNCSLDTCCQTLFQGIDRLMEENFRVLAIFIGGAGLASGDNGTLVTAALEKRYPGIPLECQSDIMNILAQAEDPKNAIAVICGTGSVVYATAQGDLFRLGGAGWRLDPQGSGYDLGRGALLAAIGHRDGTGCPTQITQLAEEKLGGPVWDHIQELYRCEPAYIASFAPLALEAWQQGDPVATELVLANCQRLAHLIRAGADRSPQATQVLLGGSILTQGQAFREALVKLLPKSLTCVVTGLPPVWGGILRACALAGITPPNAEIFIRDYSQEDTI